MKVVAAPTAANRLHPLVSHLGDGRWFDPSIETWRDGQGRTVAWIDFFQYQGRLRQTRVILATAHLDHNPSNNPKFGG